MPRLKKFEIAGAWWAIDSSGRWLRWNHDRAEWDAAGRPPPDAAPPPPPELVRPSAGPGFGFVAERVPAALLSGLAWAVPVIVAVGVEAVSLIPAVVIFAISLLCPITFVRSRVALAAAICFGGLAGFLVTAFDVAFRSGAAGLVNGVFYFLGAGGVTYWLAMVVRWIGSIDEDALRKSELGERVSLWLGTIVPVAGAAYAYSVGDYQLAGLALTLGLGYCLILLWPPHLGPWADEGGIPAEESAASVGRLAQPMLRWSMRVAFFAAVQLAAFLNLGGYLESASGRSLLSVGIGFVVTGAIDRLTTNSRLWQDFAHLSPLRALHAAAIVFVVTMLVLLTPYFMALKYRD